MLPVAWSVVVAVTVAVADQAAKRTVVVRLAEGERRPVWAGAAVARVTNRRGGLVRLSTPVAVAVVAGVVAAAGLALAQPGLGTGATVGLGLSVGGAASNVADRVRHGGVVDLIALGRWPVFNLADVAIVAGSLLLLLALVVPW